MTATTKNEGTLKVPREETADRARDYVRQHWKYVEPAAASIGNFCDAGSACAPKPSFSLFDRIQSHSLCISAMAFQDAWTIDLDRLQRCCVHVATAQKKLIPFCAYYMTGSKGQRLAF